MAKAKFIDSQVQRLSMTLQQAALNSGFVTKIPFAQTIHGPQRQAVEIVAVYYDFDSQPVWLELLDDGSYFSLALTARNSTTGDWDLADPAVFLFDEHYTKHMGTAAQAITLRQPYSMRMPPVDLEGRGMFLAPDGLYWYFNNGGWSTLVNINIVLYYRTVEITANVALEMMQLINNLSS